MTKVSDELNRFFTQILIQKPSLTVYRRNLRHQIDLDRFRDTLTDLETGQQQLSRTTIGSMFASRKTYILSQGPWRGYFRKRQDGTLVGLLFVDCR